MSHTPTPWTVHDNVHLCAPHLLGADCARIALLDDCHLDEVRAANRAFILRAVNSHADLVEALQRLMREVCDHANGLGNHPSVTPGFTAARTALAAAGEDEQ